MIRSNDELKKKFIQHNRMTRKKNNKRTIIELIQQEKKKTNCQTILHKYNRVYNSKNKALVCMVKCMMTIENSRLVVVAAVCRRV